MQKQSNSKKWTLEVEAWSTARARKVAKAVERERLLMRTLLKEPARPWLEQLQPQRLYWLELDRRERGRERLVRARLELEKWELERVWRLEEPVWWPWPWLKQAEQEVAERLARERAEVSPWEWQQLAERLAWALKERAWALAGTLEVDLWTHGLTSERVVQWTQALAELVEGLSELVGAPLVTYDEILANSDLMDIIYYIKPDYCLHFAHHLWPHRQKYWWLIQIIVPITRLPQELLHQILLNIIDNASNSPLVLMRVCKHWYTIVTGIWASLKLGTRTSKDTVTRKLKRNQWLLDVLVDTQIDRGHFTPSKGAHQGIFAAMEAASRWRSLVLETFPPQADLPDYLVNRGLQKCTNAVMSRMKTFKVKVPCERSPLLDHILRVLGTSASEELTTVEINSANVISFLVPAYSSIFRSVTTLSLDAPGLSNPADLLPHLHQLESLTASHLPLPVYHDDADLPFIHTLRHLTLKAVSIQWMNGRTFHVLESCTLTFPLHRHLLHTFCSTLPNCKDFSFEGYPLDILRGVSAHKLTHLSVVSPSSCKQRGTRQLAQFSSQALQESQLALRILHISIEATGEAWIKALTFMSNLEELVIHNAQPSSLGVKVLQSLVVHPAHANDPGATATPGAWNTPVCPSLKRFGLRYRRWLRPSEHFDLIPDIMSIIRTRGESMFFLQSFRIWARSDQKEPLELMDVSWMSDEGVACLIDRWRR